LGRLTLRGGYRGFNKRLVEPGKYKSWAAFQSVLWMRLVQEEAQKITSDIYNSGEKKNYWGERRKRKKAKRGEATIGCLQNRKVGKILVVESFMLGNVAQPQESTQGAL